MKQGACEFFDHGNLRAPPPNATLSRNEALLRDYFGDNDG